MNNDAQRSVNGKCIIWLTFSYIDSLLSRPSWDWDGTYSHSENNYWSILYWETLILLKIHVLVSWRNMLPSWYLLDTGQTLNLYETFRKRPVCLLNMVWFFLICKDSQVQFFMINGKTLAWFRKLMLTPLGHCDQLVRFENEVA